MEPLILDGKKVTEELYSQLPNMNGKELVIITIGDNDASEVYVRNKIKACERVGLKGINYKFYLELYPDIGGLIYDIVNLIRKLNKSEDVVGIMIQQPYFRELKKYHLEDEIDPNKDVDGLCMYNMYHTLNGEKPKHYPATPKGIITLLDHYKIPIEGKNVVIIGRSNIVGKPLVSMMLARNATVTVCHSKTKNLREYTRNADIIISSVGKAKFLDSSYITDEYHNIKGELCKKSLKFPVIIDVGINRDENGKLCGDVNFDDVAPHCKAITKVPGGVGPMTVYSLIEQCCKQ